MDLRKSLYTKLGKSSEHLTFASGSDDEMNTTVPKKKFSRSKKAEKQELNSKDHKNLDTASAEVEKKRSAYSIMFARWRNAYVRFNDKSDEESEKLNGKTVEKTRHNYFR
uniref:Uncharacterized protein n=1 Tax=Syphacia muris TaxID=451379 RepID=A0A0N5ACD8_9BILA